MLADPWADPRIFARVVQARLPESSSNNVFVFFLSSTFYSFTVAYQWFISKKSIILLGLGGGGGSDLFQGVKLFPWGRGRGVQMLILETHRNCDFPGGVRTLYPPSGSAHVTI